MLYVVYSALACRRASKEAVLEAIEAWARSTGAVPGRAPSHEISSVSVEVSPLHPRGCRIDVGEPRGDKARQVLQGMGAAIARATGRPVELYMSGAGDGPVTGHQTWVDYEAWLLDPQGRVRQRSVPGVDALLRNMNPVGDDCPYEEFDEVLQALLEDSPAGDGISREWHLPPVSDDPRLNALAWAIRAGAEATLGGADPTAGGRTRLDLLHPDGCRETAFLEPQMVELLRPLLG